MKIKTKLKLFQKAHLLVKYSNKKLKDSKIMKFLHLDLVNKQSRCSLTEILKESNHMVRKVKLITKMFL